MTDTLCSHQQYGLVDGTELGPVPVDANNLNRDELLEKAAWEVRKTKAYLEISLRVEAEVQQVIIGTSDPNEAWDTLEQAYGNTDVAMQVVLLDKFNNMSWSESTTTTTNWIHFA